MKKVENEYMPKSHSVWLVFDLSNGDRVTKRYCWWFDTRGQARKHIKWQKKQKYSADLSKPIKYTATELLDL